MGSRELASEDWVSFFNAFSRQYRNRPVTVEVSDPDNPARSLAIGHNLPLDGIVVEFFGGRAQSIEIILGESIDNRVVHIVSHPRKITIGQISNGQDEIVVIDSSTDPQARIDFRSPPLQAAALRANSITINP